MACKMAMDAVKMVAMKTPGGTTEIDIKNFAKVEKIPGGSIEDSYLVPGTMFNKDVTFPSKMRRRIENPRVLLLDCNLEYKKGESVVRLLSHLPFRFKIASFLTVFFFLCTRRTLRSAKRRTSLVISSWKKSTFKRSAKTSSG
jgi:hypothetical protein